MKFTIIERAFHYAKLKQKSGHGDAISLMKIRYGNSPMCFIFSFFNFALWKRRKLITR